MPRGNTASNLSASPQSSGAGALQKQFDLLVTLSFLPIHSLLAHRPWLAVFASNRSPQSKQSYRTAAWHLPELTNLFEGGANSKKVQARHACSLSGLVWL
jgi:hypothetical protein